MSIPWHSPEEKHMQVFNLYLQKEMENLKGINSLAPGRFQQNFW